MSLQAPKAWLTQEISDLLEVGSVGLYELTWLLNGSEFNLNEVDTAAVAREVASHLMNAGHAKLFELKWPDNTVIRGPLDISEVTSPHSSWPSDPAEEYLALTASD